ncbi:predicted protein [Histoplasma mississippiense (nom. inval.)]|uniref:predicted protein n=1 Tax=Ajellomyces capsulatus (strain NAm1 / WU24) TaxID=2059318 RepID=UPI000157D485|nr:predicted protein [Histoplasma mississippiense (nom. inval.)]EDN05079.1 predicted protein [Histoplasma mississippiense (nom. inval.)]
MIKTARKGGNNEGLRRQKANIHFLYGPGTINVMLLRFFRGDTVPRNKFETIVTSHQNPLVQK